MDFFLRMVTSVVVSLAFTIPASLLLLRWARKNWTRHIGRLYLPHPVGSRVNIVDLPKIGEDHTEGVVVATMFATYEDKAKNEAAVGFECGCLINIPVKHLVAAS